MTNKSTQLHHVVHYVHGLHLNTKTTLSNKLFLVLISLSKKLEKFRQIKYILPISFIIFMPQRHEVVMVSLLD